MLIILIIGILTTFTDLNSRKIYNLHLAFGAILGLVALAYASIFSHQNILFHIINGIIAFLIGFLLHRIALWRGGDAKLFALYALLMPSPVYSHIPFACVVNLFSCSFISGTAILLPLFIKDVLINHKIIIKDLLSPVKRQAMFNGVGAIVFSFWVFSPIYSLTGISNPIIIFTISYLFFCWGGTETKVVKKHYIIELFKKKRVEFSLILVFGFLMRLWLNPNSLSYLALARLLCVIALSSVLSTCIRTTFDHFKNYHERVPFAPLLFIGCILSYTPFLTKLIHLVTLWNVLVYR